MDAVTLTLLIFLGIVAALLVWVAVTYNALVRLKNQIENAWAQIDVQLKRRYDLVPNLVETVKGYARHERETLERVIQARNVAMSAQGVPDKAAAENLLTGALRQLFALSEAYPDLKANTNFMMLQEELTSTENKIAFARQFFNDRTMTYNTQVESFPVNIVAGMFNFDRRPLFEITTEAEREVPQVAF